MSLNRRTLLANEWNLAGGAGAGPGTGLFHMPVNRPANAQPDWPNGQVRNVLVDGNFFIAAQRKVWISAAPHRTSPQRNQTQVEDMIYVDPRKNQQIFFYYSQHVPLLGLNALLRYRRILEELMRWRPGIHAMGMREPRELCFETMKDLYYFLSTCEAVSDGLITNGMSGASTPHTRLRSLIRHVEIKDISSGTYVKEATALLANCRNLAVLHLGVCYNCLEANMPRNIITAWRRFGAQRRLNANNFNLTWHRRWSPCKQCNTAATVPSINIQHPLANPVLAEDDYWTDNLLEGSVQVIDINCDSTNPQDWVFVEQPSQTAPSIYGFLAMAAAGRRTRSQRLQVPLQLLPLATIPSVAALDQAIR